ncbi:MAG: hypothetical protein JSU72_14460 [Deltaproteobacteria bacterium]|nr:MAG: hypothetical protein JSU72_14460 [Deltaproteobacteria bacterium]
MQKKLEAIVLVLLLTFILVVGVGGMFLRPLSLGTCTARGGLIAGGTGCAEV